MISRIAAVSVGPKETTVTIRWYDIDDLSEGFPPIAREETVVFAGKLHHRDIALRVAEMKG